MKMQEMIRTLENLHGALLIQADKSKDSAVKNRLVTYANAVLEAGVSLGKKSAPEKDGETR